MKYENDNNCKYKGSTKIKFFLTSIVFLALFTYCYAFALLVPKHPSSTCFSDLNTDGFQDIILGHRTMWGYSNPSISILMNDGFGQFTVADSTISFCGYQDNIIMHDIDNDGNQDLIALSTDFSGGSTNPLRYLRVFSSFSLTNHNYTDYPLVRNNAVFKVICMDLPGNEHLICLVSNQGFYWGYMKFNSNGIPDPPVYYDLTNPPGEILNCDITNDCIDEIFVTTYNTILAWNWTGFTFTSMTLPNNCSGLFLSMADVNNDGAIELVKYNTESYTNITLMSLPDFSVISSINTQQNLTYPQVSDLNNDGFLDLIYTTSLFNSFNPNDTYYTGVIYYTETGFSNPLLLYTGGFSYKSYPLDINNDGFKDIVALNDFSVTSGQIHILYNDGNGGFQETSPTSNEDDYIAHPTVKLSCFPNPFRVSTMINLKTQAPLHSPIIEIYNVKGQRIKSLELRNIISGEISITWDGTDNIQKQVSSGLYFLKIKSDNIQRGFSKCLKL